MRDFLFRGKTDKGEWVQGDFCSPCNIVFLENGYDAVIGKDDCPICNDFEVLPDTVAQYTGINDKNGAKIFEGDIVRVDFEMEYGGLKPKPSYIGVVEFKDGAFGIYEKGQGTQFFFQNGLIKTVIGNVFDNPELLEGEK